jgi:hypothetical protein
MRGVAVPVLGGDLFGWYCVGAGEPGGWTTADGIAVSRFGEHSDAQCALVTAADGRVGVSWSGEFLPRYSDLRHLLEASALWASFVGWAYADVARVEPEQVIDALPGSRLAPEASGAYVRWWRGPDHAVYAEPRLTETAGKIATVSVLARTGDHARALRETLRSAVAGERPETFTATIARIGEESPEPPERWGPYGDGPPTLDEPAQ